MTAFCLVWISMTPGTPGNPWYETALAPIIGVAGRIGDRWPIIGDGWIMVGAAVATGGATETVAAWAGAYDTVGAVVTTGCGAAYVTCGAAYVTGCGAAYVTGCGAA